MKPKVESRIHGGSPTTPILSRINPMLRIDIQMVQYYLHLPLDFARGVLLVDVPIKM